MTGWARSLVVAVALLLAPSAAMAQSYPARPITIVVPAAPGGVTDLLGRALAKHFTQAWGREAIVENKPGANNQIAAEYEAKAAPDGYTLFVGPETTFVVNPFLYAKLPYDPVKDFTPISGLVSIHHALIVNPALPIKSVADLMALARQKPGALNYGTFGIGSSGHLNMEALQRETGIRLVPVHYKGATPALTDVMAGHIELMFISVGSAVPQARGGKVRIIAIGAPQRLAGLPDVPTIAESGVPGFEAVSWFALYGPANMPPAVVDKINGEVRKLFADAAFNQTFMAPQYFESLAGSPAELTTRLDSEAAKWSKLIRDAHIKLSE
jgi:tripartite-type tricarboxylate transporter receptor subunit TctC